MHPHELTRHPSTCTSGPSMQDLRPHCVDSGFLARLRTLQRSPGRP